MFDLKKLRTEKKLKQGDIAKILQCGQPNISAIENEGKDLTSEQLDILISKYGEGYIMGFYTESIHPDNPRKLIPFYDDVSSVGGINGVAASTDGVSSPSDYIDTGDWFKEATAAIRHYGESMIEYPQGCILALKEVKERKLVVWGRDYVVETNEYRITKRIQRGEDKEHIRAYSTNEDTYPDGRIIHEPLDIEWNDVRCIYAVLGYVVKKNGGTMIFSNSK